MLEAAKILDKYLEGTPGSPVPGGKTYFAIVDAMLEFQKEAGWTNEDIDAAYLMGVMNTTENPLDDVVEEIKRLERLGMDRPHIAVKHVRNLLIQDG